MRLYNDEPNFSIIVPGGCNANCSFCFWKETDIDREYISNLEETIDSLPEEFKQVSITGGEPCLSPYIEDILKVVWSRFDKVVFTTNGTGLSPLIYKFQDLVNFVNISRHHWLDHINADIFLTDSIPTNKELKNITRDLNMIGIPANLNCVITDYISNGPEVLKMIDFSKSHGFSSIAFRHQHGELDVPEIEKHFDSWKVVSEGSCPVCRSKTQLIDGFHTTWKSSVAEPAEIVNEVYELIYHPTGLLTQDWEGKQEIAIYENFILNKQEQMSLVKETLTGRTAYQYKGPLTTGSGCRSLGRC